MANTNNTTIAEALLTLVEAVECRDRPDITITMPPMQLVAVANAIESVMGSIFRCSGTPVWEGFELYGIRFEPKPVKRTVVEIEGADDVFMPTFADFINAGRCAHG